MGRMHPPGTEAWTGGSVAQINNAWRQDEINRYNSLGQGSRAALEAADEWLARFPEFIDRDGRPCGLAVAVLLGLRSQLGRPVVRREVRYAYFRWLQTNDPELLDARLARFQGQVTA